jgi:hypothetical protein
MTAFSGTGYRYRIVLSGECGSLVAALFTDVTIESARGRTCVTACVQDDSELYGLIHRFEDLALHLISLGELDVVEEADTLGRSPGPVAEGRQLAKRAHAGQSAAQVWEACSASQATTLPGT